MTMRSVSSRTSYGSTSQNATCSSRHCAMVGSFIFDSLIPGALTYASLRWA